MAAKETGRPGYDPADLLKVHVPGYINRVRSSRRLEAETRRNIEVIWLLRYLKPDFSTIADFRRVNRSAFRQVFWEFVLVCRQLDLFGRELLAVDHTRIKAVNKDSNFTCGSLSKFIREADEKLANYMKRLDESDADEEKNTGGNDSGGSGSGLAGKIAAIKGKRDRYKARLDESDRSGEGQISLTGPDARAMVRMTKVGVSYNVQFAVDVKHKLIAEQEVVNQVLGMELLAPTVEAAMEALGVDRIEAVAGAPSRSRISKSARRLVSPLTCRSRSATLPCERGSSPRRTSAPIRTRAFSLAPETRSSHPVITANHVTM
ncbi:transposase [Microvirga sp. VF16]|uniref:transposase n=1 Tax=Microvirga sp. VF16 TaxID=2807101 RepID=UPI001FEF8F55|nr:transposase [Microvirga sp. VF16]